MAATINNHREENALIHRTAVAGESLGKPGLDPNTLLPNARNELSGAIRQTLYIARRFSLVGLDFCGASRNAADQLVEFFTLDLNCLVLLLEQLNARQQFRILLNDFVILSRVELVNLTMYLSRCFCPGRLDLLRPRRKLARYDGSQHAFFKSGESFLEVGFGIEG
jgi:hypothetical protein